MEKAVAVQYTEQLPAPIVIAKGRGALAERIKEIAREHNIHIMSEPELTDALIELPLGSLIPEDFYGVIAEILVYIRTLSV
jgi:type III secretion system FlhB-like substrate exporter